MEGGIKQVTRKPGPNIGSGYGAYWVGLSYRPAFRPSAASRPASAKVGPWVICGLNVPVGCWSDHALAA
jgi:hypothetical protein